MPPFQKRIGTRMERIINLVRAHPGTTESEAVRFAFDVKSEQHLTYWDHERFKKPLATCLRRNLVQRRRFLLMDHRGNVLTTRFSGGAFTHDGSYQLFAPELPRVAIYDLQLSAEDVMRQKNPRGPFMTIAATNVLHMVVRATAYLRSERPDWAGQRIRYTVTCEKAELADMYMLEPVPGVLEI